MDEFLKPVQTRVIGEKNEAKKGPVTSDGPAGDEELPPLGTADDVLNILNAQPGVDQLLHVLKWLDQSGRRDSNHFNIHAPSPKAAQIVYVLVNDIVPAYWTSLFATSASSSTEGKPRRLLLKSLRSVAGVGAVLSRLRLLIDQARAPEPKYKQHGDQSGDGKVSALKQTLSLLDTLLQKDDLVLQIWREIQSFDVSPFQKSLQWKEALGLFASGRLLSAAGEADIVINDVSSEIENTSWIGNRQVYASWVGKNVRLMLDNDHGTLEEETVGAAAQLLNRALGLGYEDGMIEGAFLSPLQGKKLAVSSCRLLLSKLSQRNQKNAVFALVHVLQKKIFPSSTGKGERIEVQIVNRKVGGAAAFLRELTAVSQSGEDILVDWITKIPAEATANDYLIQSMVVLAVSDKLATIKKCYEKVLQCFGDKLLIKNVPIYQQEVNTRTLLLLAGYLTRSRREDLQKLSKTSLYLDAISNHLGASSERSRTLGMIVGTVISELVDPQDKRLDFGSLDLDSQDFRFYRSLAYVQDSVGSIEDLKSNELKENKSSKAATTSHHKGAKRAIPNTKPARGAKVISIEEIDDESDSEEDDLPVYAKADSDPSDSDEDPELIQRNKSTAPVYIRDLIKGLQDLEIFDRNRLALSHAASLIRNKSGFGTEVRDSEKEMASILVRLNDKWEMDGFERYRLQAMIAILVADPAVMGPWFAETFYNGEYSINQRAAILTTMGLSAREIAGLGKEDAKFTASDASEDPFPSKLLPEKLHNHYLLNGKSSNSNLEAKKKKALLPFTGPMLTLSSNLENALIRPLAAQAADVVTGPQALKIRTFSSRMEVERKRSKPAPNGLAKIAGSAFLFPLIGRWQVHLQIHGGLRPGTDSRTTATSPYLLSTMLRTFGLILHAAGPTTAGLPQITTELWTLLLSVRPFAAEKAVLEALLFAILTLLEVNIQAADGGRRLAEEHARELLETREWVEGWMDHVGGSTVRTGIEASIGGGGSERPGEDERLNTLAAAVLVRTREVVERYQRLLLGDLVDFLPEAQ